MSLKMPCVTSLNCIRTSTLASFNAVPRDEHQILDATVESRQTFSCFENEGDTFPPRIVDPKCGSSKRRADRVARNGIIVEVARLAVSGNVLTEKNIISFDRWNSTKYLDLHTDVRRYQY